MLTETKITVAAWVVAFISMAVSDGVFRALGANDAGATWASWGTALASGLTFNYFGQRWRAANAHRTDDYDHLFARAEAEIDGGNRDESLWSKALVLCKGDESRRKVTYMRLRVEQIIREEES